ncbi:hypothetical protein Glove_119g15 [Diversispora epigaea]|uniref:Uncharacterized protein n=1 Tax=Diversispora epigaea TaxID=1348612 RepID=A0A397J3L8_9GLOM|nr:hypothetical protein Glove_119g15 [Diversispora epigaea]
MYASPAPRPIQNQILTTINADIKDLKRDMLTLKNDMNRIQNETEWRSEARSQAIFNERRKREKRSPTKMYNALSDEIDLSPSTLAKFYQHQKSPQRTSLDKIEAWVEKENWKKDSSNSNRNNFSSSSNILLDDSNDNNNSME